MKTKRLHKQLAILFSVSSMFLFFQNCSRVDMEMQLKQMEQNKAIVDDEQLTGGDEQYLEEMPMVVDSPQQQEPAPIIENNSGSSDVGVISSPESSENQQEVVSNTDSSSGEIRDPATDSPVEMPANPGEVIVENGNEPVKEDPIVQMPPVEEPIVEAPSEPTLPPVVVLPIPGESQNDPVIADLEDKVSDDDDSIISEEDEVSGEDEVSQSEIDEDDKDAEQNHVKLCELVLRKPHHKLKHFNVIRVGDEAQRMISSKDLSGKKKVLLLPMSLDAKAKIGVLTIDKQVSVLSCNVDFGDVFAGFFQRKKHRHFSLTAINSQIHSIRSQQSCEHKLSHIDRSRVRVINGHVEMIKNFVGRITLRNTDLDVLANSILILRVFNGNVHNKLENIDVNQFQPEGIVYIKNGSFAKERGDRRKLLLLEVNNDKLYASSYKYYDITKPLVYEVSNLSRLNFIQKGILDIVFRTIAFSRYIKGSHTAKKNSMSCLADLRAKNPPHKKGVFLLLEQHKNSLELSIKKHDSTAKSCK